MSQDAGEDLGLSEAVAELNIAPPVPEANVEEDPPETNAEGLPMLRLFIGDLSRRTSEQSLRLYFEQYGPVEHAIVKHPATRPWTRTGPAFDHRSFGFITVFGESLAKKIMSTPHTIDGHRVGTPELAKPARTDRDKARQARNDLVTDASPNNAGWTGSANNSWASEPAATRKIFLGGLSHSTKEQALYSYFSQFGTITDAVVMTEGSSRRPRGFGFVTFEDPNVVNVITCSRYHPIEGRLVEVKAAVPRETMASFPQAAPGAAAPTAMGATPTEYGFAPSEPPPMNSPPLPQQEQQDWYGSAYPGGSYGMSYSGAMGYNAGVPMMAGSIMGGDVTTGVPVFNGYAPGYMPQMIHMPRMMPFKDHPFAGKPLAPPVMMPPGGAMVPPGPPGMVHSAPPMMPGSLPLAHVAQPPLVYYPQGGAPPGAFPMQAMAPTVPPQHNTAWAGVPGAWPQPSNNPAPSPPAGWFDPTQSATVPPPPSAVAPEADQPTASPPAPISAPSASAAPDAGVNAGAAAIASVC